MKKQAPINYQVLATILFLVWANLPAFVQPPHYHHFTTEDGLPSDAVYGVMQDRDGYIWVYTEKGISKFDGYEFRNFGVHDGLPSFDIWGLTEDSKGKIWIHAKSDKLCYIFQDSIHQIKTPEGRSYYIAYFNEHDGKIWFTEESGDKILQSVIEGDTIFETDISAAQRKLHNLRKEGTLTLFFHTVSHSFVGLSEDSVFYFNEQGDVKTAFANKSNEWVEWIKKDRILKSSSQIYYKTQAGFLEKFKYWVSGSGIWGCDEAGRRFYFREFQDIYGVPVKTVTTAPSYTLDSTLQLTLLPKHGFLELDKSLNVVDTFSVNFNTRRIMKDREGNLWVTTPDNGIYFITAESRNAKSFTTPSDNKIISICADDKGHIFYGTSAGGLYQFDDGQLMPMVENYSLGTYINGLVSTRNHGIFAGAELKGIQFYLGEKEGERNIVELNRNIRLSASDSVHALLESMNLLYAQPFQRIKEFAWDEQRKKLWFSAFLYVGNFDLNAGNNSANTTLFFLKDITAMATDNDGVLWAGSHIGLCKFQNGQVGDIESDAIQLTRKVSDLAIDEHGILWVGTEGYGAYGFREGKIYSLPATHGTYVRCIHASTDNHVWVGTDQGVIQYFIKPENPTSPKYIYTYTKADGLISNSVGAIHVDEDRLFFGTNRGLTQIDRKKKYRNKTFPEIYIEAIRINGQNRTVDSSYVLEYFENEIEIDYIGLSFKSLGKVNYWYQLENEDDTLQLTQSRTVRYPNLRPGNYLFQLKTIDVNGQEGILSTPVKFVVQPPYWQTWWFRVLSILILGSGVFLIYQMRVNLVRKREEERRIINEKFAELELQALQSQMNPHFVFNAMASIQSFIQEEEVDEAEDYLAKFAKLMRMFLESSKSKYTTLAEELKLLEWYIQIEQMRFVDRFEVEIEVDEKITPHLFKIPTLLLQPFVENAIHHGLFHKEGKGLLSIKINEQGEDVILCTIEDNGIGREAAQKINEKSIKGYQSRATQIVDERLEVLEKMEGLEFKISIVDLYDDFDIPIGTRVVLQIPFIDT